jgi:hypothetical protein
MGLEPITIGSLHGSWSFVGEAEKTQRGRILGHYGITPAAALLMIAPFRFERFESA